MRDRSDRYQVQSMAMSAKKIGGYLVEAGLLTAAQISVALNDQRSTGMRFGEIVVARGWVKEQTVEWIMSKVVEPERQAVTHVQQAKPTAQQASNRWGSQGAHAIPQASASIPVRPAVGTPPPPADVRANGRLPVAEMPNRTTYHQAPQAGKPQVDKSQTDKLPADKSTATANSKFTRREAPISKPLPSVSSSDGDVNWVG